MPTFKRKNNDGSIKKPILKGRWKDKEYTRHIINYVNQTLKPNERSMYQVLFDSLAIKFNITEPNELMLLDLAVNDYIRVKRLHLVIKNEGDIVDIITRGGQTVRKVHEAGYLINAVESQFRQNMKELLLTPRESLKKTIGQQPKDFTDAIGKIVNGDYNEDDENGNGKQSGTKNVKDKKAEPGDSVGGSEREDRKDRKTTEDIKSGTTSKTSGEARKKS